MTMRLPDAIDTLQRDTADFGSTSRTECVRFLNASERDVIRARDWPSLKLQDFVTAVAPYTTGTVTVAVDGTTVTGSGTTFTSAMAGRKFCTGYSSPWYQIASQDSATQLTLDDAWVESALSGATYIVYEDRISLPSNCGKLYELWYHDVNQRYELAERSRERLFGVVGLPTSQDEPYFYAHVEDDSSGNMQIQVGPHAPSKAYRLEVVYRKKQVELVEGSQETFTVPDELVDLVIQGAYYRALRRDTTAYAQEVALYDKMLKDEWRNAKREDRSFKLGQVRAHRGGRLLYLNPRSLEE